MTTRYQHDPELEFTYTYTPAQYTGLGHPTCEPANSLCTMVNNRPTLVCKVDPYAMCPPNGIQCFDEPSCGGRIKNPPPERCRQELIEECANWDPRTPKPSQCVYVNDKCKFNSVDKRLDCIKKGPNLVHKACLKNCCPGLDHPALDPQPIHPPQTRTTPSPVQHPHPVRSPSAHPVSIPASRPRPVPSPSARPTMNQKFNADYCNTSVIKTNNSINIPAEITFSKEKVPKYLPDDKSGAEQGANNVCLIQNDNDICNLNAPFKWKGYIKSECRDCCTGTIWEKNNSR